MAVECGAGGGLALRAGKIVVFDGGRPVDKRTVTATVRKPERAAPGSVTLRQVPLPAVTVSADPHLAAIMPPSVAERLGMAPRVGAFGVDGAEHRVTEAEERRLEEVLAGFDGDIEARVYVERGPHRSTDMLVQMLAAGPSSSCSAGR